MKVSSESWLLAASCTGFGIFCAWFTPTISSIWSDLLVHPPSLTKAILSLGPYGWFLTFHGIAGLILWKDSWMNLRVPNSFFAVTAAAIVGAFVIAALLPIAQMTLGN